MKISKLVLAMGVGTALICGVANADTSKDQGHGTIKFEGSIIDAPCSISSDSDGQTVKLGEVSAAALADEGKSTPKVFDINLENCTGATKKSVTATFTGAPGATNEKHLGITGTASGASIGLTDGSGKDISLNEPSAAHALQDGSNTLEFSAYLQGDGASATVVPGEFQSVSDFTLSYE